MEELALYTGCKALGVSPFAAMPWTTVRACKEVVGHQPKRILQQASLQTRHFPVPGQGKERNNVGDWLIAPVQQVGSDYSLAKAQSGGAAAPPAPKAQQKPKGRKQRIALVKA